MEPVHEAAARELIASIRLAGHELDTHFTNAVSPAYWKALVPGLSIDEAPALELTAMSRPDSNATEQVAARFQEDGYFQLPPIVPLSLTSRMRAAVSILHDHDWPHVFSWVYDEFWRVPRLAPIVDVCSAILGSETRQAQNVWTHLVSGDRGRSGWAPHVDHRGPDTRLTMWIPLTDATVGSGCLCVLPKRFLPRAAAKQWYERTTLPMAEVTRALHAVRPLPATAGAVLGWDGGLLHWGLARQEPGEPRISFSMEFVGAHAEIDATEDTFAVGGDVMPTLRERLKTIAIAIKLYQGSEPRASRYVALADRLLERPGS